MTLMQEAAGISAILEMVLIIARLIPNLERFAARSQWQVSPAYSA